MEAWTLQGGGGVLLMVVNDQERNVFDQGFIEASLGRSTKSGLSAPRFLLFPCISPWSQAPTSAYTMDCPFPSYTTEPDIRRMTTKLHRTGKPEKSTAVKCPCIDYHLAGVKKVQQLLCSEEHLSRLLPDPAEQRELQAFLRLFSVSSSLYPNPPYKTSQPTLKTGSSSQCEKAAATTSTIIR